MNRRELLKAIALLPPLKSVEVAKLGDDDVIVVTSTDRLSVVLDAGLSMHVVKG